MKPTNAQVKRFKLLDSQLKKIEQEREELRQEFIKTGTFSTSDYVVVVEESNRESVAGLTEFRKTGLEDLIREKGLVKATSFRKVMVREKE